MVHWQANYFIRHLSSYWQIFRPCTIQSFVCAELADEGIEIAAAKNALLAHLVVELVTGHAVFLGIDKDGEVAVVMAHTGEVVPELDAFDVAECLAVADGYLMAGLDGGVDLAEVEEAVGGAYLVHLAVDAGGYDAGLASETEVLEVVDALFGLLVVHHHSPTLHGVVHLGGVETQRRNVASCEHALALAFHTEGVGGIVDDL